MSRKDVLKIVLCGDFGVGKKSLVQQFVHRKWSSDVQLSSIDAPRKQVAVEEKQVTLELYTVDNINNMTTVLNGSSPDGCLLLYDISNKTSFDALEERLKAFYAHPLVGGEQGIMGAGPNKPPTRAFPPVIIVGNKFDLAATKRDVIKEDVTKWAQSLTTNTTTSFPHLKMTNTKLEVYEASAKTADHIDTVFYRIARLALNINHNMYGMAGLTQSLIYNNQQGFCMVDGCLQPRLHRGYCRQHSSALDRGALSQLKMDRLLPHLFEINQMLQRQPTIKQSPYHLTLLGSVRRLITDITKDKEATYQLLPQTDNDIYKTAAQARSPKSDRKSIVTLDTSSSSPTKQLALPGIFYKYTLLEMNKTIYELFSIIAPQNDKRSRKEIEQDMSRVVSTTIPTDQFVGDFAPQRHSKLPIIDLGITSSTRLLPDHYQLISKSFGGRKADLNAGSGGKDVFVSYLRDTTHEDEHLFIQQQMQADAKKNKTKNNQLMNQDDDMVMVKQPRWNPYANGVLPPAELILMQETLNGGSSSHLSGTNNNNDDDATAALAADQATKAKAAKTASAKKVQAPRKGQKRQDIQIDLLAQLLPLTAVNLSLILPKSREDAPFGFEIVSNMPDSSLADLNAGTTSETSLYLSLHRAGPGPDYLLYAKDLFGEGDIGKNYHELASLGFHSGGGTHALGYSQTQSFITGQYDPTDPNQQQQRSSLMLLNSSSNNNNNHGTTTDTRTSGSVVNDTTTNNNNGKLDINQTYPRHGSIPQLTNNTTLQQKYTQQEWYVMSKTPLTVLTEDSRSMVHKYPLGGSRGPGAPIVDVSLIFPQRETIPVDWHELNVTLLNHHAMLNTGTSGHEVKFIFKVDVEPVLHKVYSPFLEVLHARRNEANILGVDNHTLITFTLFCALLTSCLYSNSITVVLETLSLIKKMVKAPTTTVTPTTNETIVVAAVSGGVGSSSPNTKPLPPPATSKSNQQQQQSIVHSFPPQIFNAFIHTICDASPLLLGMFYNKERAILLELLDLIVTECSAVLSTYTITRIIDVFVLLRSTDMIIADQAQAQAQAAASAAAAAAAQQKEQQHQQQQQQQQQIENKTTTTTKEEGTSSTPETTTADASIPTTTATNIGSSGGGYDYASSSYFLKHSLKLLRPLVTSANQSTLKQQGHNSIHLSSMARLDPNGNYPRLLELLVKEHTFDDGAVLLGKKKKIDNLITTDNNTSTTNNSGTSLNQLNNNSSTTENNNGTSSPLDGSTSPSRQQIIPQPLFTKLKSFELNPTRSTTSIVEDNNQKLENISTTTPETNTNNKTESDNINTATPETTTSSTSPSIQQQQEQHENNPLASPPTLPNIPNVTFTKRQSIGTTTTTTTTTIGGQSPVPPPPRQGRSGSAISPILGPSNPNSNSNNTNNNPISRTQDEISAIINNINNNPYDMAAGLMRYLADQVVSSKIVDQEIGRLQRRPFGSQPVGDLACITDRLIQDHHTQRNWLIDPPIGYGINPILKQKEKPKTPLLLNNNNSNGNLASPILQHTLTNNASGGNSGAANNNTLTITTTSLGLQRTSSMSIDPTLTSMGSPTLSGLPTLESLASPSSRPKEDNNGMLITSPLLLSAGNGSKHQNEQLNGLPTLLEVSTPKTTTIAGIAATKTTDASPTIIPKQHNNNNLSIQINSDDSSNNTSGGSNNTNANDNKQKSSQPSTPSSSTPNSLSLLQQKLRNRNLGTLVIDPNSAEFQSAMAQYNSSIPSSSSSAGSNNTNNNNNNNTPGSPLIIVPNNTSNNNSDLLISTTSSNTGGIIDVNNVMINNNASSDSTTTSSQQPQQKQQMPLSISGYKTFTRVFHPSAEQNSDGTPYQWKYFKLQHVRFESEEDRRKRRKAERANQAEREALEEAAMLDEHHTELSNRRMIIQNSQHLWSSNLIPYKAERTLLSLIIYLCKVASSDTDLTPLHCSSIKSLVNIKILEYPSVAAAYRAASPMMLMGKDEMILRRVYSLQLLHYILDKGDEFLKSNPASIHVVRRYIIPAIINNTVTLSPPMFFISLKCFVILSEKYNHECQQEIGMLLSDVFLELLISKAAPVDFKVHIFELLELILNTPTKVVNLYQVHDNSGQRNVYEKLLQCVSIIILQTQYAKQDIGTFTEDNDFSYDDSNTNGNTNGNNNTNNNNGTTNIGNNQNNTNTRWSLLTEINGGDDGNGNTTGNNTNNNNHQSSSQETTVGQTKIEQHLHTYHSTTEQQRKTPLDLAVEKLRKCALRLLMHHLHMLAQWTGVPSLKRSLDATNALKLTAKSYLHVLICSDSFPEIFTTTPSYNNAIIIAAKKLQMFFEAFPHTTSARPYVQQPGILEEVLRSEGEKVLKQLLGLNSGLTRGATMKQRLLDLTPRDKSLQDLTNLRCLARQVMINHLKAGLAASSPFTIQQAQQQYRDLMMSNNNNNAIQLTNGNNNQMITTNGGGGHRGSIMYPSQNSGSHNNTNNGNNAAGQQQPATPSQSRHQRQSSLGLHAGLTRFSILNSAQQAQIAQQALVQSHSQQQPSTPLGSSARSSISVLGQGFGNTGNGVLVNTNANNTVSSPLLSNGSNNATANGNNTNTTTTNLIQEDFDMNGGYVEINDEVDPTSLKKFYSSIGDQICVAIPKVLGDLPDSNNVSGNGGNSPTMNSLTNNNSNGSTTSNSNQAAATTGIIGGGLELGLDLGHYTSMDPYTISMCKKNPAFAMMLTSSNNPLSKQRLEYQRVYKEASLLAKGKDSLKDMLKFLHTKYPRWLTPYNIAAILYQNPYISPDVVGDYLSNQDDKYFNTDQFNQLRTAYTNLIDFSGMSLITALRYYLTNCGFRMPGEGQKVERTLNAFCIAFLRDNPDEFGSLDVAMLVCYAAIMLNTELHNPNTVLMAKKNAKPPMSLAEFINNVLSAGAVGKRTDVLNLVQIYIEISTQAIEWIAEDDPTNSNTAGGSNNHFDTALTLDQLLDLSSSINGTPTQSQQNQQQHYPQYDGDGNLINNNQNQNGNNSIDGSQNGINAAMSSNTQNKTNDAATANSINNTNNSLNDLNNTDSHPNPQDLTAQAIALYNLRDAVRNQARLRLLRRRALCGIRNIGAIVTPRHDSTSSTQIMALMWNAIWRYYLRSIASKLDSSPFFKRPFKNRLGTSISDGVGLSNLSSTQHDELLHFNDHLRIDEVDYETLHMCIDCLAYGCAMSIALGNNTARREYQKLLSRIVYLETQCAKAFSRGNPYAQYMNTTTTADKKDAAAAATQTIAAAADKKETKKESKETKKEKLKQEEDERLLQLYDDNILLSHMLSPQVYKGLLQGEHYKQQWYINLESLCNNGVLPPQSTTTTSSSPSSPPFMNNNNNVVNNPSVIACKMLLSIASNTKTNISFQRRQQILRIMEKQFGGKEAINLTSDVDRCFIRKSKLIKLSSSNKKQEYTFFLFNDVLIYAMEEGGSNNTNNNNNATNSTNGTSNLNANSHLNQHNNKQQIPLEKYKIHQVLHLSLLRIQSLLHQTRPLEEKRQEIIAKVNTLRDQLFNNYNTPNSQNNLEIKEQNAKILQELNKITIPPQPPARFKIISPQKSFIVECQNEAEMTSWTSLLQDCITKLLVKRSDWCQKAKQAIKDGILQPDLIAYKKLIPNVKNPHKIENKEDIIVSIMDAKGNIASLTQHYKHDILLYQQYIKSLQKNCVPVSIDRSLQLKKYAVFAGSPQFKLFKLWSEGVVLSNTTHCKLCLRPYAFRRSITTCQHCGEDVCSECTRKVEVLIQPLIKPRNIRACAACAGLLPSPTSEDGRALVGDNQPIFTFGDEDEM